VELPPSSWLLRCFRVLGKMHLQWSSWCPRRRSLLGHPVELPLSSWVPRLCRVLGELPPSSWRQKRGRVLVA
jgi:hypothetical protein